MEFATLLVPLSSFVISLVPMMLFKQIGWRNTWFITEASMVVGTVYAINSIMFLWSQPGFGQMAAIVTIIINVCILPLVLVVIDFMGYEVLKRLFPKLYRRFTVI